MKTLIFTLLLFISFSCFSQYIGVKARYTATQLVDDAPNPPKRENRLILSFFEVTATGQYIPVSLSNYDIWVYKVGLQYGSFMGGVLDSSGNNYSGYAWPAPKAVAYYNSYYPNYIDCDPNAATHYIVNGHELDCGFITVSYWDIDYGTGNPFEAFPAPNVCLPYYIWPHPYAFSPGNANFSWPVPATAPYNWYSFACAGSTQQLVIRGVLQQDSSLLTVLPVRFANVKGEINASDKVTISWSNLTESDILQYEVERSADGISFQSIGTVLPSRNNGGRADYTFISVQPDYRNFYRIKAIETSGGLLYSTIINLTKTNKPQLFSATPNPVTNGEFTFRLTNAEQGRYVFSIINLQGQQIKQQLIIHSGGGDINRQVDISGLPPGVYQLILWSATERYSQKIINVY